MKTVLKLTLPAMALVAGAATLPAERDMMGMMKEGEAFFCVGGEGGVTVGSSKVTSEGKGLTATPVKVSNCLGTIGGHGGIFIGAGYAMSNNIFFGIEGNAFWGEAEAEYDLAGNTETLRVQDSYGANLSAGYRMKSACPFVRVGYLASCWELKAKNQGYGDGKHDEYKSAIVFGLGMDMMVAEHVCVGLTWDYAWYGDFSLKTKGQSGTQATEGIYKVSPQVSFTKLRVKFMF